MSKLGLILITLSFIYLNGFGQQIDKPADPNEQIIVNKEFDENGNLIGYDSTYIHSWSSDTSLHFNFDEDLIFGEGFPDMNQIFENFFGDSTIQNSPFPPNFGFSPFDKEDFFKKFNPGFSDSTWMQNFDFNIDSIKKYHHEFVFPDLEELQKQLQEQLKYFDFPEQLNPDSLTNDQRKELEELQKKHQKELNELRNKWK